MVTIPPTAGTSTNNPTNNEVRRALEQCDEILEQIDDLPDAAFDFGDSVGGQVSDIAETIERTQRVTSGQQVALNNMQRGIEKWLNR